jgi:hypothetical protein
MRHRLSNGKLWKIELIELKGLCDYDDRTITIGKHCSSEDLVDTVIHELLHAEYPKMKHKRLKRVAGSLARGLCKVLKRGRLLRKIVSMC